MVQDSMVISADGLDLDDPGEEGRLELMRGPAGKWREDREFQLRTLERLGIRPDHDFLEIGCGPLLAGAPLIRFLEPGRYTGVDVSEDRLSAARELVTRFGLDERQPRLLLSEDFGLDRLPPRSFDRIWSYQVVLHLTQPLVLRFMTAVAELLKPSGVAWFSAKVASDDGGFKAGGPWLEFPVNAAGESFYRSSASSVGLECTHLGTLGQWGLPPDRPGAKHLLFQLRHSR
jgi:SAM-dependent methyltransferase